MTDIRPFNFGTKTRVVCTESLTDSVVEILGGEKVKAVGLLLDEAVANHPDLMALQKELETRGIVRIIEVFKAVEPTTAIVDSFTELFRAAGVDFVIGIGGGSTLDLAKAVSAMAALPGSVTEYHGTSKPVTDSVRKIMIPTTAGTGSEVTPGAVLVNESTNFKRAFGGDPVTPEYALLYLPLTLSMPPGVMVATGMDALAHAIESYTTRCANPLTRMYSMEAFRLIWPNLIRAVEDSDDRAARKALLLGSNIAGFAIYNSNTGAAHAMAYPMGIFHKIPHGVAVAKLLPGVVNVNVEKGCHDYADFYYEIVKSETSAPSRAEAAAIFAERLTTLEPLKQLGKEFADYGIGVGDLEFIAERGLDLKVALDDNPVEFTLEDGLRVLRQLVPAGGPDC